MTTTEDTTTETPGVSSLTDRELHRRAGLALKALRKVEQASRPNRRKLAVAVEQWGALRAELARRVADGSWSAWDRLGFTDAPSGRNQDGRGGVWHDRANDRYVAQLKHDGQRFRKVCASQADAEVWLDAARKRIAEGRSAAESAWTVAGWLDHLLAEVWPREGLSVRTLANHQAAVDRWWRPAVGGHRLVTLQPEDVDRVIGRMVAAGLSPNTVRIATAPMTKALGAALRRGYVARNVASLATKPKLINRRVSKYLDPAESRVVLAACPDARFGDAIALTMLVGLRRGEVLGLCWDRVDLDSGRPTVTIDRMLTSVKAGPVAGTKTGQKGVRTIVLPTAAVAVLRRAVAGADARLRGRSGAATISCNRFSSSSGGIATHGWLLIVVREGWAHITNACGSEP